MVFGEVYCLKFVVKSRVLPWACIPQATESNPVIGTLNRNEITVTTMQYAVNVLEYCLEHKYALVKDIDDDTLPDSSQNLSACAGDEGPPFRKTKTKRE